MYIDPEIMDRVLHNLVDNALKFTPDGGKVQLWARLDSEHDPATMLVGVSDTGPGIPQEAQARLFRKFQQVVSNMGRRVGTGLGLPFCKLAVEAHGGENLGGERGRARKYFCGALARSMLTCKGHKQNAGDIPFFDLLPFFGNSAIGSGIRQVVPQG